MACTPRVTASICRWARSNRIFYVICVACWSWRRLPAANTMLTGRMKCGQRLRAVSLAAPATNGWRCWLARTPAWHRYCPFLKSWRIRSFAAAPPSCRPSIQSAAFSSSWVRFWQVAIEARRRTVCHLSAPPTPMPSSARPALPQKKFQHCAPAAVLNEPRRTSRESRSRSRKIMGDKRMTDATDLPPAVQQLIGVPMYEEKTEFPIETGYVYNTCAAVQNGNPIFWDPAAAEAITGGPIAPPTMLSVWLRPHHWAPGAHEERRALQAHFDLKQLLDMPEAVVSSNEAVFGEPVRIGDQRSEEHTSELQSPLNLVCRLLLEKKKNIVFIFLILFFIFFFLFFFYF